MPQLVPTGIEYHEIAAVERERCRDELGSCLIAGAGEVVWVAGGERVSLKSAPLDVSPILSAQVFGEMPVVLTSATLPPGLAQRLGAPPYISGSSSPTSVRGGWAVYLESFSNCNPCDQMPRLLALLMCPA